MRLNFSGVTEEEIREGILRIGEVVSEQVALYETLTGETSPAPARSRPDGEAAGDADVLPFRRAGGGGG
jgi:2-aminoadipate transaminase